ncbi:FRG domain-containing protein [Rhizobium bangladeshense]|nr:FRG domain-containing protein [Rhizobium bangladeshense]
MFATVSCADWQDFRFKVSTVLSSTRGGIFGEYVFRGQSCSSWSLSSSFDRKWKDISHKARDNKYAEMLAAFRENLEFYGDLGGARALDIKTSLKQLNEAELESIAQHNGLKTRLLDWSQSVYVAAFFAFSRTQDCESGLVSIFALHKRTLRENFSNSHIKYAGDLYKENTRQLWQYGAFTRNFTSERQLEELFKSSSSFYDHSLDAGLPCLLRFDIPVTDVATATDDLKMMRINSMTIFPGLEGVVRWIEDGGYA